MAARRLPERMGFRRLLIAIVRMLERTGTVPKPSATAHARSSWRVKAQLVAPDGGDVFVPEKIIVTCRGMARFLELENIASYVIAAGRRVRVRWT